MGMNQWMNNEMRKLVFDGLVELGVHDDLISGAQKTYNVFSMSDVRRSLAHWFVTLRLSLNKDFSKW